jgi:predicted RNA-binding protein (virulence factor B family)
MKDTMSEGDTTVIRIYERDKNRIAAHGHFGESFADVISRILDDFEENKARESKKVNPCEATLALALA